MRVAGDKAWAPIEFIGQNGEFTGLAVDYLAKISELLGVNFEYDRKSSWLQVTKKMKDRKLDMFSAVAPSEKKKAGQRDVYKAVSEHARRYLHPIRLTFFRGAGKPAGTPGRRGWRLYGR
ncbi:MAG: transporter substrate-binding domain-containing protein [Alphaproteobacteria bacterium]